METVTWTRIESAEEVLLKTCHWLSVRVLYISADLEHAGFLWCVVYPCLSYMSAWQAAAACLHKPAAHQTYRTCLLLEARSIGGCAPL